MPRVNPDESLSGRPARRYDSRLRDEAARRTRRLILAAARDLFLAQGYAGTTIEQIAQRAGVSKPTVFASAGSKRSLLKELRDQALAGDDEPIPVRQRPWFRQMLAEPEPARSLRLYAHGLAGMHQRGAQLEEQLRNAASADPELRQLWDAAEAERHTGARTVITSLMAKTPLKPGLDQDTATDVLWILTAGDAYRRLVDDRGWPVPRYEAWLGDAFCAHLLPPPVG